MTPDELFDRIVEAAPSFQPIRDEHLQSHGELLPHVLLGDLRDYLGRAFGQHSAPDPARPSMSEVRAILGLLDLALSRKHPLTENAIAVSFVEGLEAEPHFASLEPLLGPELRAERARQEAWWNAH